MLCNQALLLHLDPFLIQENFEQQQEESIPPPSLFCPDYSSTSEYDDNTRCKYFYHKFLTKIC